MAIPLSLADRLTHILELTAWARHCLTNGDLSEADRILQSIAELLGGEEIVYFGR